MLRRPILINRPVKLAKVAVYRPAMSRQSCEEAVETPAAGLKRTARLAEKLRECATHAR